MIEENEETSREKELQNMEAPAHAGEKQPGTWSALTGPRAFRSALQAWEVYGQYRFAVSQRTFLAYVGKGKAATIRHDGCLHVEDIEIIAQTKVPRPWPPAPSFCPVTHQGGEGGKAAQAHKEDTQSATTVAVDYGAKLNREKALKAELERKILELDYKKRSRLLLPVVDMEKRMAAAAAVVGAELENFVYDKVREVIHVCAGDPQKEDDLRTYLHECMRDVLHGFSREVTYKVEFTLDEIAAAEAAEEINVAGGAHESITD